MTEANSAIQEIGEQTARDFQENRQDLSAELERIQRDEDLSDSAKSRLTQEARTKASERHRELLQAHEEATKDLLASNEQRLFRLSFPEGISTPSEIQQFRNSYRDASFTVLNLEEDTLSRVMTRAARVGDSALAQACYHEAIERGVFSVADEFRERHPDAKAAWEIYEKTRLSEAADGTTLTKALLATSNPAGA